MTRIIRTPPLYGSYDEYRFSAIVRYGKLSHERFAKARLAATPLDFDVQEERDATTRKKAKDQKQTAAKVRVGSSRKARGSVEARRQEAKQKGEVLHETAKASEAPAIDES